MLESLPVRENLLICQLVLEMSRVALCVHEVEEGRVSINLVTCADHGHFGVPIPLERQRVREVSLVNPGAVVCDPLSLEAAELESDV